MESLNDDSPRNYECKCRASSRKRKSCLREFCSDDDDESYTDKSKKIRSGAEKEENCTGYIVESESEWENDEYEASDCGSNAAVNSSIGIGEEAQSEYENSDDFKPNHYETAHESEFQSSYWKASPNPWIAECAHGTATLKWPVYTANQPPLQLRHEEQHAQAQPLIRAAWAGDFIVYCDREETRAEFEGLKGCVSSKACAPARWVVEQLRPSIVWDKLPRCSVWPKSFERRGPTDDDIAVFFFPSLTKHETAYDSLVFDLIRDDLAMRTWVMGSELLLFTSVELPPLFTRFQGKFYLWGVFRGNQPKLVSEY